MSDDTYRSDLFDVCEELLKSVPERVNTFLPEFDDTENPVFSVTVAELDAIDNRLTNDWHNHPGVITKHIEKVLGKYAEGHAETHEVDAETPREFASLVENRTLIRVEGYDSERVYDVGKYRPDNVADRMIHLRGQVTKRSERKLRDEMIAWECDRCGRVHEIRQSGEQLQEPYQCAGCEQQGPFSENPSMSNSRNFQNIRLQTLPEEAPDGETDSIDLRVYDDLVGELSPGDRAVLNVWIKTRRMDNKSLTKELVGDVHAIDKLTSDYTDVDIEPHKDEILEIADSDDPFQPVIESVAPFHTGDEDIRFAIALQLFSGVEKSLPDGTEIRGNSHMLMMGDPGVGKSTIIEYVSELVPRAEYATGKNSTSAGLTASAVKDDFADGGWTLQAGTLVRANKGLAAIDELDKMSADDRDGMMEAMSQQRITVNMVASGVLPAKCSVLAAANPKYGSFDPTKDIGGQLDLDSVLLSRFDLWFVMRDEPDEDTDRKIATTMTGAARAGEKLKSGHEELDEEDYDEPPIPPEMFRAYVAMAKERFPILTDEAQDRIIEEYVNLRQLNDDDDGPVPTTARVVEGLVRLAEASARIRLSEDLELEDVERAIDILYTSLESLGIDPESGEMDAMRFETGRASSAHERLKAIAAIIDGQTTPENPAHYNAIKEEAMVIMDESDFETTFKKMQREGHVTEPEANYYRTT